MDDRLEHLKKAIQEELDAWAYFPECNAHYLNGYREGLITAFDLLIEIRERA